MKYESENRMTVLNEIQFITKSKLDNRKQNAFKFIYV